MDREILQMVIGYRRCC